jgi:hypothetical protein
MNQSNSAFPQAALAAFDQTARKEQTYWLSVNPNRVIYWERFIHEIVDLRNHPEKLQEVLTFWEKRFEKRKFGDWDVITKTAYVAFRAEAQKYLSSQ